MKLPLALIIITLIVCGCFFGIPEYDRIQERALASRVLALKERTVTVNFILTAPEERHGLKAEREDVR